MYIAPVILQELRDFEFEDALLSKCYPQVPWSLGHSKNTQQSRSSCFPIQLLYANMLSRNCQKMTKPSGDQLFLQAAPNTDTEIILPSNSWKQHHILKKKIDSRECLIRFIDFMDCIES